MSSCPGICPSAKAWLISSSSGLLRQVLLPASSRSTLPAERLALLELTAVFYQAQLDRYPEALSYLQQRGLRDHGLRQQLRIGYAPGGSLRRHLMAQGYSFELLRRLGQLNSQGRDTFYGRVVFPLFQGGRIVNLYGRSLADDFAHRFLPGPKGGLYAGSRFAIPRGDSR